MISYAIIKTNTIIFCLFHLQHSNTGGLGGAFGYFYGVGKPLPIPECQPYKPSMRFRLLNALGRFMQKFKK